MLSGLLYSKEIIQMLLFEYYLPGIRKNKKHRPIIYNCCTSEKIVSTRRTIIFIIKEKSSEGRLWRLFCHYMAVKRRTNIHSMTATRLISSTNKNWLYIKDNLNRNKKNISHYWKGGLLNILSNERKKKSLNGLSMTWGSRQADSIKRNISEKSINTIIQL